VSKTKLPVVQDKSHQRYRKRPRNLFGTGGIVLTVFLAAVALFVSGCGAARPSKYYELEPPNDLSSAKASDPLPITLLIGRLKASHLYREDRIVYGTNGEQMGTYEYQRWAEPPTEMIEQMLLRELRASGHYAGIYSLSSERSGDYLLHGTLFDFREVSGGSILARVSLDLELRDMKTGSTVWTRYYSHDEPVSSKDISAVVAAIDKNTQRAVSEIRASLDEYFTSHPSK
jgi:cholesterol transport system auxiliary component